jgi:hypothetical protein
MLLLMMYTARLLPSSWQPCERIKGGDDDYGLDLDQPTRAR